MSSRSNVTSTSTSGRVAGRSTGKGRFGAVAAAGTGVGGLAVAAWATQHRMAARSREAAADRHTAGLGLPVDVVHHRIDVDDGGVIHAVERGSGPPIVLLHGVTLAADVWSLQLAELAEGHRVIALDLRGHGQSVAGSDGFTGGMSRLAADVHQVLDALHVDGALLVGHSMGGMVAMQLVVDAEASWTARRLRALALVDTSAEPLGSLPGTRWLHRPLSASLSHLLLVAERAGLADARSADFRWWASRLAFGADVDPSHVAFTQSLGAGTPMGTLTGLLGTVAGFDLTAQLGKIDLPALVVVGTRDRLTPPGHARRMAGALRNAELVELPRAGHMPMLERPHELTRLLRELAARAEITSEADLDR